MNMKPALLTPETMSVKGFDLLEKIQDDFIGLDTKYKLADGTISPRIYLDSTASTLMMGAAYRASKKFLNHYSNTHSLLHFSARISTKTYEWIHHRILDFVSADKDEYTSFFMGSGVTAGMNRVAKTLNRLRPDRDIVLVSMMEHHSNDLPHRKHGGKVIHIPLEKNHQMPGKVNIEILEKYLNRFSDRINYVSITGLSNVTGIINNINEIAAIVHKYNVYLVVDAAQMAAHVPIKMSGFNNKDKEIDVLLFSGHKTYAPGSPGVVVARKSFLNSVEPEDVGGGMVDKVYPDNYFVTKKFPDREEAGTPNILGAITLGSSIHVLDTIGMNNILDEDKNLIQYTMNKLTKFKEVHIYGDTNITTCPRAGTISFNIKNMDHGLVAAILNDYFNIAVRNECFCAHPYVQEMLSATHKQELDNCESINSNLSWKMEPWMGMVRISFGIYNKKKDVDFLVSSIEKIIKNKAYYKKQYKTDNNGDYKHLNFEFSSDDFFSLTETIDQEITNL